MGRKIKSKSTHENVETHTLNLKTNAIDSSLDALFNSSLPAAKPSHTNLTSSRKAVDVRKPPSVDIEETSSDSSSNGGESLSRGELDVLEPPEDVLGSTKGSKKRKHASDDDLEGAYLQKLAHEQDKDEARRKRVRQGESPIEGSERDDDDQASESDGSNPESDDLSDRPQHETLNSTKAETELEKASRTVFLGNVSTSCIKSKTAERQLKDHLSSFFSDLSSASELPKIESLRFRSTAFSTASVPKKAAFARKELMDATTQSTNAYAVFTTPLAAREAVKRLNGTMVLDRHLRVDGVAHPAKIDHQRCVFVGNLGFVDDESNIRAAEGEDDSKKPRKVKPSADVEEGLWRQFGKAGEVESVRVVRDKTTRVGKGFAYVQFKNGTSVEKALLFNDKKFPPLLPRKLRVTRAKSITKTASHSSKENQRPRSIKEKVYTPKTSSQAQSLAGRAGKLLGRAGAAHYRKPHNMEAPINKSPEKIVFEGHRARANQGKGTIFGKAKKKGKPTTRSSKRGAAYKAAQKSKA